MYGVELPTSVDPRRLSFDHLGEEEEARDVVNEKLARRISVSTNLSKNGDKDTDKEGSRPDVSRMSERWRRSDIKDAIRVMRGSEPRSPRATSLAPGASAHDAPAETAPI